MFPEYRDLISRLKIEDAHFARLFERHNELDRQVHNMETGVTPADGLRIEFLKKERLRLKDSLYAILRKADAAARRTTAGKPPKLRDAQRAVATVCREVRACF